MFKPSGNIVVKSSSASILNKYHAGWTYCKCY
jgi:hypothetical protein